jgi:predicted Rossmann fold flavoprotein
MHAQVAGMEKKEGLWQLTLQDGRKLNAEFVCIAGGGFPKAEQFSWITHSTGHTISDPVPSLFTFNTPGHLITGLMGVSQKAHVKIAGTKFEAEGPVLITHWGLSGPAILRTSAFAARFLAEKRYQFEVVINWLPEFNENSLREKILVYRQEKGNKKIVNTEWFALPDRLLRFLMKVSDIDEEQRWADLPAAKQNKFIKALTGFALQAKGKTTFKDEFVTAGGISLSEIDPNTMQSRLKVGLYFAGETMDVDGITGGFNFQHAWTSGMLAAQHIASVS